MRTYNFLKSIKLYLFSGLLLVSCNLSEFGDMNKDKNASTEATTRFLLTGALKELRQMDVSPNNEIMVNQNIFVQYFSETQYPGASIYDSGSIRFSYFNNIYKDILFRLKLIKDANLDKDKKKDAAAFGYNNSQIAIAEILSCYFYQLLTDTVGDIPYSQALGEGKYNFQPKYDSQEFVYKDIFKRIAAAIKLIDDAPSDAKTVQGDILFNGNLTKWKMFANMLRATAAMRISNVKKVLAKQEFEKAKIGGLITNNSENLRLTFLNDSNFENPWYSRFRSREDYAISDVFVNFLKDRKDKRLFKFAEKTETLKTKKDFAAYNGLTYGLIGSEVGKIAKDSYSYPNKTGVRKRDGTFYLYTYAQSLFLQAEAVHKNLIPGNAEELYENAIKASFEQWGVEDNGYYATYLADPKVKWDNFKAKQLLGEQKWVALFLQGSEAWASWRRLHFPDLKPAPGAVSDAKKIPLRLLYPQNEEDNNSVNYKAVVKKLGVDDETKKVWWDK